MADDGTWRWSKLVLNEVRQDPIRLITDPVRAAAANGLEKQLQISHWFVSMLSC